MQKLCNIKRLGEPIKNNNNYILLAKKSKKQYVKLWKKVSEIYIKNFLILLDAGFWRNKKDWFNQR